MSIKMINSRKKKNKEKLIGLFGNIKDDLFHFEQIESYFRSGIIIYSRN